MTFGATPISTTSLGTNQFPASAVYVPETAAGDFMATAGAPGMQQTDQYGTSVPVLAAIVPLPPTIMQKASAVTGSAGKTLTIPFPTNTTSGNTIIVVLGMGEVEGANIALAVTDSSSNTYRQATSASQSTTLEAAIFYAPNIATGATSVTITISGSSSVTTAIAAEIYEIAGVLATNGALDTTATGTNAGSTSVTTAATTPLVPNELYVTAIAAGGGTITAGTNWNLDSSTLSPTGGNLVSFGSQSRLHGQFSTLTPSATLGTSNAWAACAASFKPLILSVEGQMKLTDGIVTLAFGQNTMANSLPVAMASNQSPLTASTGTKSNVSGSASSVTLLASNASRKQAIIYNDSTALLYLDLSGGTASSASYSVQVPPGGYFELPPQPIYTGAITGIWASATGTARVTEFS